jgi:hypothetical protein
LSQCGNAFDGPARITDELDDPVRVDRAGGVGEGLEVGTGTEGPAGSGQHDDPDGFVGLDVVQTEIEFVQ